jgi:hypothetical protein
MYVIWCRLMPHRCLTRWLIAVNCGHVNPAISEYAWIMSILRQHSLLVVQRNQIFWEQQVVIAICIMISFFHEYFGKRPGT